MNARVLFFSDSPTFGGHELMTIELIRELAASGEYDVGVQAWHPAFAERVGPDVDAQRLSLPSPVPFPGLRPPGARRVRAAAHRMTAWRPDLVVVAQGNVEFCLTGLFGAREAQVPVVSYLPFAWTFAESGSRLARLRDAVDRRYYQLPDACILEADHQIGPLRRFFDGPVHVIPYPLTVAPSLAARSAREPKRRADGFHIGVVGRLNFRHKNYGVLPAVLRILQAMGVPSTLHILGDGRDGARLRRVAEREGVADRLVWHGWLERERVHQFVADELDLVVVPSHFEGVPLAMLETVAVGTPVVLSDLPYVKDYDVPSALVVRDRTNPGAVAAAVRQCLENFDAPAFGRFRASVLRLHERERFRGALHRVFRAILGR